MTSPSATAFGLHREGVTGWNARTSGDFIGINQSGDADCFTRDPAADPYPDWLVGTKQFRAVGETREFVDALGHVVADQRRQWTASDDPCGWTDG